MKIVFSGGGTLGSVSPLIAIFQEFKKQRPDAEFLWLATRNGPEQNLITFYGIPLKKIFAGKFRRYFSWENFFNPIFVILGFFQAFFILFKFKPEAVIAAGGFIAVPVAFAAWLLKKPVFIHQQDIVAGLANRLMAPWAKKITVTFEKSLKDFSSQKTVLTGNPVRNDLVALDRKTSCEFFKFDPNLPVVLIIGGSTGALNLNNLVLASISQLVEFCQVIHLTGGKISQQFKHPRYQAFDFLTQDLKQVYAACDLVVSRGGMSVLTELAYLKKSAIIIPISQSHQENNAIEFFRNNAALFLAEKNLTPQNFISAVKEVIGNQSLLSNLSRNIGKMMPTDAATNIVRLILSL